MTSITHRRRQCTTFCKHIVAENNYGCLQNVVRKQFRVQKSGQRRRGEPQGDRRKGRGGRKSSSSDSGFKDGLGHDKKTGRTEEEPRHEDFVQIHDVNNPQEKAVYNILQAYSSGKQLRMLAKRRQKAVPRAEERTATTKRTARGSTGRKTLHEM
jgi:hypothetical protein